MLILASNSPRRRQLLKKITADFIVLASNYDEARGLLPAKEYAMDCAAKKAEDVFNSIQKTVPDDLTVLAADTIVVLNGKVLGKPKDAEDAKNMLESLSNKKHSVITGICIKTRNGDTIAYDESIVAFKKLTAKEIEEYIKTGSPFDKAGAYGIQDVQIKDRIKNVEGSIDNVIGLPTELVRKLLIKC